MNNSYVSDIARQLNAGAAQMAPKLLPEGKRAGSLWQAGDISGAAGQSLAVTLSGNGAGKWRDYATGEHGDLLDLIQVQHRCSMIEAARIGAKMLGGTVVDVPLRDASGVKAQKPSYDSVKAAKTLWEHSQPIAGTHGAAYLAARGIDAGTLASCTDMRFLAEAKTKIDGKLFVMPAIITAVRDVAGQITGVHRTFLSASKPQKASIKEPKKALGQLHGSGANLASNGKCLVIAEGIETALSIKAAFPGVALIAALTAPHMALLNVPAHFTRIAIAADPDMAGLRAAAALANRLIDAGWTARIIIPHDEQADFNDLLMVGGADAIRKMVAVQIKPN